MAEWMVGLSGHELDLQKLSELFNLPGLNIVNEGNGYYIKSSDFDLLTTTDDVADWRTPDPDVQERLRLDSVTVRSRAVDLLSVANGFGKVCGEGFESVALADVLRVDEDGSRLYFKEITTQVRISASLSGTTTGGDEIVSSIPSEFEAWATLALGDQKVQDALHFFHLEPTWWSLRKGHELVAEDLGQPNRMEKHVRATREEIESFLESANSPVHSGLDAVHAPTVGALNRSLHHAQMSLSTAISLIKDITRDWLRWKQQKQRDS